MKTIINNTIMDLLSYYIANQLPFTIKVQNYDDWDFPLPARLNFPQFTLNIENTDLEESYVESDGSVWLTAGIDDNVYLKEFKACDIAAIGPVGGLPVILKPYVDKPVVKPTSPTKASESGVEHSTNCFRKSNPTMGIK
jgi:hypothetical protein